MSKKFFTYPRKKATNEYRLAISSPWGTVVSPASLDQRSSGLRPPAFDELARVYRARRTNSTDPGF